MNEDNTAQQDKLDKRLAKLTAQALSLEERAEYAEKEARLLERIAIARKRLRTARPPDMLDGVTSAVTSGIALWHRIPIPVRVLFVLVGVVVVLLIIGNAASSSGG